MKALKILIVEDELIIAESIKEMAEELGHEVIAVAGTFQQAKTALSTKKPDLALLDINLNDPDGNGLDLGTWIQQEQKTPFVFITSYSDAGHLSAAKSLNPQGYILKPLNKDRLFVALELAMDNAAHRNSSSEANAELQAMFQDSFFVKDGIHLHKIAFDSIFWLKSEGNYTEIVTKEKTYLIRSLLKEIIERLPAQLFLRTHRSYIINSTKVTTVAAENVVLNNDQIIPVGDTFKKDIRQFFEERLSR